MEKSGEKKKPFSILILVMYPETTLIHSIFALIEQ